MRLVFLITYFVLFNHECIVFLIKYFVLFNHECTLLTKRKQKFDKSLYYSTWVQSSELSFEYDNLLLNYQHRVSSP